MKPPYELNGHILRSIASISEKVGQVNANFLNKGSPQLRKQNKIKTIHSSLQIEGNTLSEDQITALIENKKVVGSKNDITEVLNAIKVYDGLGKFDAGSSRSFLKAHELLMKGLIKDAGTYRKSSVGIMKGSELAHVAPPAKNVPYLMKDLFSYLKQNDEPALIKSCVFHYEMEFIHPFMDGNGRMGRLWQTLILMGDNPIFEFLPFETLIIKTQKQYYKVLAACDKAGNSTLFIEYMLKLIDRSISELLNYNNRTLTDKDRIDYFLQLGLKEFTRKDYMSVFKDISTATASRDLKEALRLKLLKKTGSKNQTRYRSTK